MRYLLLQTFLLLLATYFFGAFLGCFAKRVLLGRRRGVPARAAVPVIVVAPATARSVQPPPVGVNVPPPVVPAVPRVPPQPIEPGHPRIEYADRPDPYPVPKLADPKRFERALMGPEPNEGMPRVAVVEIRPKVLPPPTEAVPSRIPAVVASAKAGQERVTPPHVAEEAAPPEPQRPRDAVSAASAAAVAAAKAAAAALAVSRKAAPVSTKPAAEETSPNAKTSTAEKTGKKADDVKTVAPAEEDVEDGDDLQRIRAIDAEAERKLKDLGVLYFEHIAVWTASDVKRMSEALGMPGRIDREQWVEQAQILAKGGETYYSRNRREAQKADAIEPKEVETEAETETEAEVETEIEPQSAASGDVMQSPAADADEVTPTSAEEPVEDVSADKKPAEPLGAAAATRGRSISELAMAAASAVAAASASVTRGVRPVEPVSPLSKVDPNISMPARLTDAIRKRAASAAAEFADEDLEDAKFDSADAGGPADDLKRIRGIGVLIEKRLNAMGVRRYNQIANWTSGDIDRVSHALEFGGRIERENWVQQARILSNGGHTEFSRRVDRGEFDTSRET